MKYIQKSPRSPRSPRYFKPLFLFLPIFVPQNLQNYFEKRGTWGTGGLFHFFPFKIKLKLIDGNPPYAPKQDGD